MASSSICETKGFQIQTSDIRSTPKRAPSKGTLNEQQNYLIHLAKRVAGTMYIYFITTTSRASKRFFDPLPIRSLITAKLNVCGMKQ